MNERTNNRLKSVWKLFLKHMYAYFLILLLEISNGDHIFSLLFEKKMANSRQKEEEVVKKKMF